MPFDKPLVHSGSASERKELACYGVKTPEVFEVERQKLPMTEEPHLPKGDSFEEESPVFCMKKNGDVWNKETD